MISAILNLKTNIIHNLLNDLVWSVSTLYVLGVILSYHHIKV